METIRGTITLIQFTAMEGHTARYEDNYTSASTVTFNVGERPVTMLRDETFPALNVGDDVEVSGTPNPNSGVLEVQQLRNHTTGGSWEFSASRAATRTGCPLAMSAVLIVFAAAFAAIKMMMR